MDVTIRQVGRGNSFFQFVYDHSRAERSGRTVTRPLHRLCSLMRKMEVESVIIEELDPLSPEIGEEWQAINAYFDKTTEIIAFRFTFIAQRIESLDDLPKIPNDLFLSSAVLVNFEHPIEKAWRTYLFSAFVATPGMLSYDKEQKRKIRIPILNNYLHVYSTFPCKIEIPYKEPFRFEIKGTFFCQQNSLTSVCAHAALCMTVNNMGRRDIGMISSESINRAIGVDHKKAKVGPDNGLSEDQIKEVLKHLKLTYTWMDFFQYPNYEYNEYIYRYLEGRCPVLLVFSTATALHVVPVLGHTLNSDIWRPEAESAYSNEANNRLNYKSTAAWTDHFIIHDDNFGMYFCLPVDALKRVTLPKYDPTFRAKLAVVISPQEVKTPAWEAEWASVIVTKDRLQRAQAAGALDEWSTRIIHADPVYRSRPIVVRTLLATKQHYVGNLDETDFSGNAHTEAEKAQLTENLPDLFWLSEITLPDLYTANRTKIVDFFYACDHPPLVDFNEIFNRWIQIRFPHVLLVRKDNSVKPMAVTSHYPLFRFDKPGETFDW